MIEQLRNDRRYLERLKRRWFDKVRICANVDCDTHCWPWVGTIQNGYGKIGIKIAGKYKSVLSHRIGWELYNDIEIPVGWLICHDCNYSLCNNPRHWKLGTYQDNATDRATARNIPQNDICELYATGEWSQRALAKKFGISEGAMQKLLRNSPKDIPANLIKRGENTMRFIRSYQYRRITGTNLLKE